MTAALVVPKDWSELTPEWMTAALAERHPGAIVDAVTVAMRDDGTNRRARLALTYAAGPAGPATVFVKAVDPEHKAMVKLTSGLLHEPRLFNSKVELPLEHPLVYAAVIDEADEDFLLVMEDLTARGADPRDSTRPYTVDEAASGVRGLARMHARYWGERVRRPELDWLEPFVPWDGMQYAPLPAALDALGADAPASVHALTIENLIEDVWKPYVRTLTVGPPTLLHGDAHVGNTYLTPAGDVGFLDWQVARKGNFALDLGYFLQGAITTEDRRAHERELLADLPRRARVACRRSAVRGRDLAALPCIGRARAHAVVGHRERGSLAAPRHRTDSGATVFGGLRRPPYGRRDRRSE